MYLSIRLHPLKSLILCLNFLMLAPIEGPDAEEVLSKYWLKIWIGL